VCYLEWGKGIELRKVDAARKDAKQRPRELEERDDHYGVECLDTLVHP
jgi:hypothetical protein